MKKTNITLVTICIFIATFMTAIEGTIVTTAMPTIVGTLHGMEIMNWVFSIYLLTSAMMTPIYGKLSDKIGRKPVFMVGVLIFVAGSTLCGFSDEMLTLIIARAIQGIGAGAIMPVSLTIIADLFDVEKRAKVLGFTSAAWGIASVFGPLAGGLIVDTVGWHWIFFINLPIGLILLILLQLFYSEKKVVREKQSVDYFGALSLMGMLLSLLLGFQTLGDEGLNALVIGMFVLAVLLGLAFVSIEKKVADPIIDLSLFNNPTFAVVNLVAALLSGALMSLDVYIPMWMQGVLGTSAGIGGLVLAPLSIVWMIGSFVAGRLVVKLSINKTLVVGLVISFVGFLWLALTPFHTVYGTFLIITTILGMGMGITITTTTVGAQSSVEQDQIGVATSFNTLVRTIGQTVMVAIFGIIMNQTTAQKLAETKITNDSDIMNKLVNPQTAKLLSKDLLRPLRHILFDGLHGVYLVSVILIALALILSIIVRESKKIDNNETTQAANPEKA
jgi:EmrB/QacA subfamily drug resistance transporter